MKRARVVRTAVAALAALVAAGIVARASVDRPARAEVVAAEPPATAASAPTPALFEEPTAAVLLFDDGYDGVLAVDLDARLAARRDLEGQRAGDQAHRLLRVGDHLVVGWDEVHAVSLLTGESRSLGRATVAVPAVEDGRVWLIDYPDGGIGAGRPSHRLVDLTGVAEVDMPGLDPRDGIPAAGVPGGLALEDEAGVRTWHPNAVGVADVLDASAAPPPPGSAGTGWADRLVTGTPPPPGPGFVGDADGRNLVWCHDPCEVLQLHDLTGMRDLFFEGVAAPPGLVFAPRSARLSPNGRLVAAFAYSTGAAPETQGDTEIVIVDTERFFAWVIGALPDGAFLSWSPDGATLWAASHSYGRQATAIARYDPAADTFERTTLPLGAGLAFEVLDAADPSAFRPEPPSSARSCAPPSVNPSGRMPPCGFTF